MAEVESRAVSDGLLALVARSFSLGVGAGSICSEFLACFSHKCFSAPKPLQGYE